MWMVGYNESGEFNMADHSFNGRKTRPFMPIPMASPNNALTTTTSIHGNNFFPQYNHYHPHQATMLVDQQSKRDDQYNDGTPAVVSSRWNPTPEQLRALEELYTGGTRTPSAEQIEHITAQLRRFGKIEGKNVFYWFQNHKARERQKRRRQMESSSSPADDHGHQHHDCDAPEKKDSGTSRTVSEVAQTKNWALATNCSTLAEESVLIQKAAKAVVAAECRTDGWLQFDEGELQQTRNFLERNDTWHMMHQLPCPLPPAPATNLIKTPPNAPATTSTIMATTTTTTTVTPRNLIKTHDLTFFISPQRENEDDHNNCVVESQTLQLFPLRSGDGDGRSSENINHKETEISASAMNANLTPSHQFFEFLPLKN